ncbi:DASS family sodium-coupled anion symporter [Saprospiraceae bacterium]|jgi:sodium-dependent dicarboxylate transporter 2/3/5|nr:DASS family sodium-coupled anion symporter [Saprospiraceae bacterium]MDG1436155.1 DASS family sodium-coupled anion symporter [Saprospiraceae bacterium]
MNNYSNYKKVGFLLGPLLFLFILFYPEEIINPIAHHVIAVAAWMVCWWVTEAVSISVTALIPLTIFPLVDVMSISDVAKSYAHPIVFLFFGGFIIALALEKVNLHRRIALSILKLTGTNADGVVLGFMLATALMSMWISNTASTVVMLPIALSVIKLLINDEDGFTKNDKNFALSIMLGIAFSANIGGMATIVGTPPNMVMVGVMKDQYNIDIGFFNWMKMGVPFAILLLSIAYLLIVKVFYPNNLGQLKASGNIIDAELKKLGKVSRDEKLVLVIFLTTAFLWMIRSKLEVYFPQITDTGISMLGALALFVFPLDLKKGKFTLDWKDTSNLPWGILILFGGGLALAGGLKTAGLIDLIGNTIAQQEGLSIFIISTLLIFVMLFMTELMSNVALVNIFVPVVAGIAIGLQVPVLQIVIPVTLAASCAFMLPMATPPNAIVFASGHIKVFEMAKVGIVLNIISVLLLVGITYLLIPILFT